MSGRDLVWLLALSACGGTAREADTTTPEVGDTVGPEAIDTVEPEAIDTLEPEAIDTLEPEVVAPRGPRIEGVKHVTLPLPTAVNLPMISGFSVNARIHPAGVPTRWHVEYGSSADYGATTDERALPGKLAAHFVEDWESGTHGWTAGFSGKQLTHHASGGPDGGAFVRYTDDQSAGNDVNHFDGIGLIHLGPYIYPGNYYWAEVPPLYLGGGFPDLRGARIEVSLRGVDWVGKGAEIGTWIQAYRDPHVVEVVPEDSRYPNWAYTDDLQTRHLASGEWEAASWTLVNDVARWTFAGAYGGRLLYDYGELESLLKGVNVDIFLWQVLFVDFNDQPSGSIDTADLHLTYRQRSLCAASNGGTLSASPGGSDAAASSDGWRFGEGHEWLSAPAPSGPQTFEYTFAKPVVITSINVVNSPAHPSRDLEVAVSEDGATWTTVASGTLPERSDLGPNFAFFHADRWVLDDAGVAIWAPLHDGTVRRLRVTVLSGYADDAWGLGEIEAFGTGAVETPEDDWYDVNRDVMVPAGTWHYRVVATNEAGVTLGPDMVVTLP